jgi:hypothetical protein
LFCNPAQCGEPEWRLQFVAEMIRETPQAKIAKKRMCWDFGSHFNIGTAFRALGFVAQWLCHENYGDKQREQSILLDIAVRYHFKNVPTGFSGV